jgi:hypothetical protein
MRKGSYFYPAKSLVDRLILPKEPEPPGPRRGRRWRRRILGGGRLLRGCSHGRARNQACGAAASMSRRLEKFSTLLVCCLFLWGWAFLSCYASCGRALDWCVSACVRFLSPSLLKFDGHIHFKNRIWSLSCVCISSSCPDKRIHGMFRCIYRACLVRENFWL